MTRKSFFKNRSVAEIRKLNLQPTRSPIGLVDSISNLGHEDSLELMLSLTPSEFVFRKTTENKNSRSHILNDKYHIPIPQPRLAKELIPNTPAWSLIKNGLSEYFKNPRNDFVLGFSTFPVLGRDRRKNTHLFDAGIIGSKIFAYSEHVKDMSGVASNGGIETILYDSTWHTEDKGIIADVKIPSRAKGHERYELRIEGVPFSLGVCPEDDPLATALGLKTIYQNKPKDSYWRFGYNDLPNSKNNFYTPQDVAAYLSVAKKLAVKNKTPAIFNPFFIPSRELANFYSKLQNNILIYDATIKDKNKLRGLHQNEINVLLGRFIKERGYAASVHDRKRDGLLKDYNWTI